MLQIIVKISEGWQPRLDAVMAFDQLLTQVLLGASVLDGLLTFPL